MYLIRLSKRKESFDIITMSDSRNSFIRRTMNEMQGKSVIRFIYISSLTLEISDLYSQVFTLTLFCITFHRLFVYWEIQTFVFNGH